MHFQPLGLEQIPVIRKQFEHLLSKTCDYTVGGMFMWRDFYNMEYALTEDAVFTRLTDQHGAVYYNLPMGEDIPAALNALKAEELARGSRELRFCTIPEEYVDTVARLFDDPQTAEQTDFADYLYSVADLAELKGRKYGGQRNLISQFKRRVDSWSFSVIDKGNISSVLAYYRAYCRPAGGASEYALEESRMVEEVLQNTETYGMIGGVLEADGKIIGFSFGELIGQTLYTHIERADRQINGAYQMLVNQFVQTFGWGKAEYVNREEDMGDLGLRTAKKAYHPICQLKKYTIEGTIS